MAYRYRPQIVHLKTIDGIQLEAWLWTTPEIAPAVVMTHGVSGRIVTLWLRC